MQQTSRTKCASTTTKQADRWQRSSTFSRSSSSARRDYPSVIINPSPDTPSKGKHMVDADGVERFNNMFHENSMLHTENNECESATTNSRRHHGVEHRLTGQAQHSNDC
ncbi:hypothetical protein LSAT2_001428 [Lamellibrachia satsuma]|nr:hypothetical protein LSAT2_001428 [Lamellibrachia satsuma]